MIVTYHKCTNDDKIHNTLSANAWNHALMTQFAIYASPSVNILLKYVHFTEHSCLVKAWKICWRISASVNFVIIVLHTDRPPVATKSIVFYCSVITWANRKKSIKIWTKIRYYYIWKYIQKLSFTKWWLFCRPLYISTHCGLLKWYGDIDMDQHWLR